MIHEQERYSRSSPTTKITHSEFARTLVAWNKNIETGSGYSKEELNNISISDFVQGPDKEKVLNKFSEVFAGGGGEEQIIEYSVQSKSGNVFPVIGLRSLIVLGGQEYFIGIAVSKSKINKGGEKPGDHFVEIKNLKNQLEEHYIKVEDMMRSDLQFNTKAFNSKLINSMPGIFYAYEKVGGKFFLKKWNKNYTIDLGYSNDELLNMEPHQFFSKKEYEKAGKAIMNVFTIGAVQVELYTTHKNGKQIPYFYEAYQFEDEGRQYFVGVGLDVSERYALEKEKKLQERRERRAKEKLDTNKRELIATALEISRTSKTILYAFERIDDILLNYTESESEICNNLIEVKNDLKLQIRGQDNWEIFKLRFTDVYKGFFDKLKVQHPTLTRSELKFCAYLRINLTSSQISSVLNVSNEGIKKNRYRIRKKLGLARKDSLEDYIAKF